MLMIDLLQADRFLQLLDEEAETFTFQTFDDEKKRKDKRLARVIHGSLDDCAAELLKLNQAGAGVFVTVNATDGAGRKNANIVRVRALWQEDDGQGIGLPVEPHMIVESSPGKFHRYILIDDQDGSAVREFDAVQARLTADYGSDRNAADLARVLRLPGFFHQKDAPFMVRLVHESGELPITWTRAKGIFPPVTDAPTPTTATLAAASLVIDQRTAHELRSALAFIRSDERDVWIRMGMALKELGDVGRGLWLEWSQTSEKYDPRDAARTWASFQPTATGYRAIFAEAQRLGWPNPLTAAADPQQPATATPNAQHNAPHLKAVDLAGLQSAEVEPPRYVLAPLLPRGHVTLLGAHGGSGKSMLALTIAAHAACGARWAGFQVEGGPSLFLSLEDDGGLVRWRLRNVIEAYALDHATVAANLLILDGTDGDGALAVEGSAHGAQRLMATPVLEEVRHHAKGRALVVVDNASDAYDANEIDRRKVRRFVRLMLGQIARDERAAVLLLAHVDKTAARFGAAGNSYSGSTAWHNSARSRLALIDKDGALELVHEKNNLGRKAEPIPLAFAEHGVLIPRTGADAGAQAAAALLDQADDTAVFNAIEAAAKAGVNVPTGRTGPSTTLHVLCTLPELPSDLRTRGGRDRFWAAVNRLQAGGRIRRETYTTDSRNQRERWVTCVSFVGCVNPPIPPMRTNARTGSCVSSRHFSETDETDETNEGGDE